MDINYFSINKTGGIKEKRRMVPKVIQRPSRSPPRFQPARWSPTKAMGAGLSGAMGVPPPPGRAVVSATQTMVIVIAAQAD